MNQEDIFFQKRLRDLANIADRRGIATFTDFLNLNEQNIFYGMQEELAFLEARSFGGYLHAERQMIAFIPDALSYKRMPTDDAKRRSLSCAPPEAFPYNIVYPIVCLKIRPLNEKFAEPLTHRDYLGAILNLGIARSAIGDILVEEPDAWVFCVDKMADFLCRELTRIRHTAVTASFSDTARFDYQPKLERRKGSVASVRLDSLLSLAFGDSRSSMTGLIEGGKVFVNARLVTSNGCRLKENDLISVRGLGRFRYLGESGKSRKGRTYVEIEKYI